MLPLCFLRTYIPVADSPSTSTYLRFPLNPSLFAVFCSTYPHLSPTVSLSALDLSCLLCLFVLLDVAIYSLLFFLSFFINGLFSLSMPLTDSDVRFLS